MIIQAIYGARITTVNPKMILNGVSRLTHLGVIAVEGEDAAKFIHGQLTQDFVLLDSSVARLAAFCSAKGRVQASFIGIKARPDLIVLICSRDILQVTLKRLSMFVLRAKARLRDATDEYALFGLAGEFVNASVPDMAWARADHDGAMLVNLYPAYGIRRQLCCIAATHPAPHGPSLALEKWLWGEVHSGVATISAAVVEAFVPQMLNYESVGGVNFKKGCYPGQEVVARSQFRGTLKRRAHIVHCATVLSAGDEVFGPDADSEAVGTVVQASVSAQGGFDAIISIQLASLAQSLHVGGANGSILELLPLPYILLDDI
jgi:tRNA-modifying protein YgfZ